MQWGKHLGFLNKTRGAIYIHTVFLLITLGPAWNKAGLRTRVFTVALSVSDRVSLEMPRGEAPASSTTLESWQDPGHIKKARQRKGSQLYPRTTMNFTARQRVMGIHLLSVTFAKMFSFRVYCPTY